MSVILENVSKQFGQQKAVDSLSFTAKQGEILGFLGPNGAGKTTTMKMITAYTTPDKGSIKVMGIDVAKQPQATKKMIGYLPEHNPLYKDMYVKEYLNFVARLFKIPSRSNRIKDLIDLTGLGREQKKIIGTLSKGYRQRVGLAQALLHDPQVLILDEPVSGLDPNQLSDIRQLIKTLGQTKTVIFSTHIMQEVEAICDRVVIINQGKLVTNEKMSALQEKIRAKQVQVKFAEKLPLNWAADWDLEIIENKGENEWLIAAKNNNDVREVVFNYAKANDKTLLEIVPKRQSIETLFRLATQ